MEVPINNSNYSYSHSTRGKWETLKKTTDEEEFKSMYLKCLPYDIFNKLSKKISQNFESWSLVIAKIKERQGVVISSTPISFLKYLCGEDLNARIRGFLHEAYNANGYTEIKKILLTVNEKHIGFEKQRENINKDKTMGYLKDLSSDTLYDLAVYMNSHPNWKKIADGLGFNLQKCLSFEDPLDMLTEILTVPSSFPLSRLHYEAKRLKFYDVCEFIEKIPLEGEAKISFLPSCDGNVRYLTRFDLFKLNEIFIENGLIIMNGNKLTVENYNPKNKYSEGDYWQNFNNLEFTLNYTNGVDENRVKQCFSKFSHWQKSGMWEPKNGGGVTYSQIVFLAKSLYKRFQIRKYHSQRHLDFDSLYNKTFNSRKVYDVKPHFKWDAEKFLLFYWQWYCSMDLDAYCKAIIEILNDECKEAAEAFRECYMSIRPWRSYDPQYIAKKTDHVSNKVIHKPAEEKKTDNSCVVCLDRKVTHLVLPCAHLAYCQVCIEQIKNCSMCQGPIAQKMRVYTSY